MYRFLDWVKVHLGFSLLPSLIYLLVCKEGESVVFVYSYCFGLRHPSLCAFNTIALIDQVKRKEILASVDVPDFPSVWS